MSRDLDWTPRVGMKVVCVKAGIFAEFIQEGAVYAISAVRIFEGDTFIALAGVCEEWALNGFRAWRFRPLDETSDPIAIFREILRTADQRIEEEA